MLFGVKICAVWSTAHRRERKNIEADALVRLHRKVDLDVFLVNRYIPMCTQPRRQVRPVDPERHAPAANMLENRRAELDHLQHPYGVPEAEYRSIEVYVCVQDMPRFALDTWKYSILD